MDYAPFGEDYRPASERYKFTGKEDDFTTGLYYFNARYYDPAIGRFITEDPAKDGGNWYLYCSNNPLGYMDPDGEDAIPIVFKDYKISTLIGKLYGLGHAGILLINNKNGYTKYYEYGRYDTAGIGKVNTYIIPNVTIDSDTGMPTEESLNKVLNLISKESGQGGNITGAYIKNDNFAGMNKFAQEWLKQNNNKKRRKYNLFSRNCITFSRDVIEAGGVDLPRMIDPRPNAYIEKIRNVFRNLFYDSNENKTEI